MAKTKPEQCPVCYDGMPGRYTRHLDSCPKSQESIEALRRRVAELEKEQK